MQATTSELVTKGKAARAAARQLARAGADAKNSALRTLAGFLEDRQDAVLAANAADCEKGRRDGLTEALIDRLMVTPDRLRGMAGDVRTIADLPDPVGETLDERLLPNGLRIARRRVPLGVIAAIYESRPNVTVDIGALGLKAGNAVILRGGREAQHSNTALAALVGEAIETAGLPPGSVQVIESPDRALVAEMLKMRDVIDLLIPRGGAELIRYVVENATMPVVAGGIGVCHTYVDAAADLDMAVEIAVNAKCRRTSICNALDTLLVHERVATPFLRALASRWNEYGIEARCDERSRAILAGSALGARVRPAAAEDFGYEFLASIVAVRVVDSMDEAMAHIEQYGSGHSEAIVTEDYSAAQRFLDDVDAAAVYVNASTQFTDGGQFGLGAEVGISTQKMHARGPMGLREMTSYKWVIQGSGQVRPL